MKRRTIEGECAMTLSQLLDIRPGVTAVIGGGGKTTLLRTLGEELAGQHPVLLCTTTKILPFSDLPCARTAAELDELRRAHQLLCAGTDVPGTGKLTAPETPMAVLAEQFDYILVEADGAARRPLKAHAPHEPVRVLRSEDLHTKVYVNQVETLWNLADARVLARLMDCPVLAGSLWRREYFPCW